MSAQQSWCLRFEEGFSIKQQITGTYMATSLSSVDDEKRVRELTALKLLEIDSDPEFDSLTQLASDICDAPVSLISIIDQDRLWFKSRFGFSDPQAPRTHSFCSQVLEDDDPLIVEDATLDPRFQKNEYVRAPDGVRFYAGIPLLLSTGIAVGSLCVIDRRARTLSEKQISSLKKLARLVVALIESRRTLIHSLAQESELLVSKQRLDFALQAADIGDWDMDLRTNVARRSRKHDQCFGYSDEVAEWGYETFLAHVYAEDRERVDACFKTAMAGEGDYSVEFRVVWPDKSKHWLWSKGRFYFDENGAPCRVAGIQVDITRRKESEQELRESEYRWKFAIEGSGDGLWDWDIQNNKVFYSERWKSTLGLENDDVGSSPMVWASHLHLEDKERVLAEVQADLDGATSHYSSEHRMICKDGGLKWILGRGIVVQRDAAGKAIRMIGTTTDITERKRVESELQASNSHLKLLETCIARLNDIVLISEAEPVNQLGPRIVFVNDAFVRRTGFSREEAIGQTPRILQGEKTQRKELDRIRNAIQRWEPVRAEVINYTKSGEEFWVELDIVPIANSAGWFTHWVSVQRDVTHRKLAEEYLRESEVRHRSMFESNPQPMWVYDIETLKFLSVNDATIAQYGYSREELGRMTLRDIRPSEDLPSFNLQLAIDFQSRSSGNQLWTHVLKDGTEIQVEISAHAIDFEGRSARLVLAHDITERLKSQSKVQYLAFHDVLTGLPNRTQFLTYANAKVGKDNRPSHLGACILFDLDNFKSINDHWGHRCGDELLKQVAQRIQQCLPSDSFFARLGGDEFIVLIDDLGEDQVGATLAAQELAQEIILTFAKDFDIENRHHFTSASLGIVFFGQETISVDELLSMADSAMYSAKDDGRNTARFFDEKLQAQIAAKSELESDLRKTLQNDELHLVYQPQVDRVGKVVGAEALLRWDHPVRGSVSPAHFIPAAEDSGSILQIGLWVLNTACVTLAGWQGSFSTANLTLAVNVSAKQFHHPEFVSQVLNALEVSGANPKLLKLELTESLLAQDLDGIVKKMGTLKDKGVTFSLDDFGTGYSSLAYLKKLPLDQLKIDQGFVRDILVDSSDAAIVRTVIALAERLSLNVIAEGVETSAQLEFLKENSCSLYQGYLFSRPLRLEMFEDYCASKNAVILGANRNN